MEFSLTHFMLTISLLAYAGVIIWGFKKVAKFLNETSDREESVGLRMMMSTTAISSPTGKSKSFETDLSYAKVSGAIGSIAIAALFVGLGYYILFALFTETNESFTLATKIDGLQTYFLAGAALFLPFAFEKLAEIFN